MKPDRDSIRPHNSFRGSGLGTAGAGEDRVPRSGLDKIQEGSSSEPQTCVVHPVDVATGAEPVDVEEIDAPVEEEDTQELVCLPSSYQPTRSDYLDHCVTHFPFRAWCAHCVEGRGREFGHATRPSEPTSAPVVSFDCAFIGDDGEIADQE